MESHNDVGSKVSYGDTQGKNGRDVFLADLKTIETQLSKHPSFGGMAIHDWEGWRDLPETPTEMAPFRPPPPPSTTDAVTPTPTPIQTIPGAPTEGN